MYFRQEGLTPSVVTNIVAVLKLASEVKARVENDKPSMEIIIDIKESVIRINHSCNEGFQSSDSACPASSSLSSIIVLAFVRLTVRVLSDMLLNDSVV